MKQNSIKVLHVARRFVSKDLSELNIGYDLEHFKAMSKLMLKNSVIFQAKEKEYYETKIDNLRIILVPSMLKIFSSIIKLGKEHDLIVAQNPFVAGFLSVIAAFLIKKPVIISVHGHEFTVSKKQSFMKKFVCLRATKIRAISKIVKKTIMSWGISPEKIEIIQDRVDCDHFNPSIDGSEIRKKLGIQNKMVISVGSLIEIKGFDTLLEAVKLVNESISDVKFVIVGKGPLKSKLIKKAEDLGISDVINFVGYVPYSEIPKYFVASDLFVHPSYIEGMGRVILEAQASGIPVVATDVGGIPEAVTEKSAFLVKHRDPKALASGILKILNNKELGTELSKNGREFVVDNFEFWKQEEKLISFYSRVIENN